MEFFLPIALILVGLGLIAVEVYLVPGFNVVGIFGFIVILFAIGYTFTESGLLGGIYVIVGTAIAGAAFFTGCGPREPGIDLYWVRRLQENGPGKTGKLSAGQSISARPGLR